MTQGPWASELATPGAVGLLAALRRRDPGLPSWDVAVAIFRDYDQQVAQDRIARALASAYQATDLRAGPILVALLWRRICARVNGDQEAAHSLVVALLEVCLRYEHLDRSELPMRLVSAAADRARARTPAMHTVPLADLLPARQEGEDPTPPGLLTPGEAMRRLGIKSPNTLINWAKSGRLTPVRSPTGRYHYHEAEIERIRDGRQGAETDGGDTDQPEQSTRRTL